MISATRLNRTCIVCRSSGKQHEFIRVCAGDGGGIVVDLANKLGGRGAYVHRVCLGVTQARKPSIWERALRLSSGTLRGDAVTNLVLAVDDGSRETTADGIE